MAGVIETKNDKKYIDKEEILYEYDLEAKWGIEFLFLAVIGILFGYAKSKNYDLNIIWIAIFISLLAGFLYFLLRDFKTYKSKGIYITQNHFISYTGEKVHIKDIYYCYFLFSNSSGFFEWTELSFYKNRKFLFYCKVSDSNEYKMLIDALIMISKNDNLLKKEAKYNSRQKLIIKDKNGNRS